MSIDVLQNRIRKMKNPLALVLDPHPQLVPEMYASAFESEAQAAGEYCCALLDRLKDLIPAVRINFNGFALLGADGMVQLDRCLRRAKELGYYVILDWMKLETPAEAERSARILLKENAFPCDGVTLCGYAGSDCVKPYIGAVEKKAIFVALKTANKSGAELQDLQTGGRVVYTAAADLLNRRAEEAVERCGYSRIAAMAGANNGGALRTLRQKYRRLFLLVDGLDATGGNAKNVSYAFDQLGHGALCCASASIMGAWKEAEPGTDPMAAAVEAVERIKRNLNRYVTIL